MSAAEDIRAKMERAWKEAIKPQPRYVIVPDDMADWARAQGYQVDENNRVDLESRPANCLAPEIVSVSDQEWWTSGPD